jgi:hypothetical protein
MSGNSEREFDDDVAGIVEKLEGLPLFKRRDKSAVSLALTILAARYAADDDGDKESFVENAEKVWEMEEARAEG